MLRLRNGLACAALALASLPFAAQAAALTVVNVGAPAVNCVFNVTCTEVVTDSVGAFTPPGMIGAGRLQSRTSPGIAPAPAGGKMDYEYRVDLTSVSAPLSENCVTKMQINFGPVVKEPYPPGPLADVYVVTSGGLGSVVVSTATQSGNTITFSFADPTTVGVCPGATSYFFGLTSAKIHPIAGSARLFYSNGGSALVHDRVP
ncbi:MAG TPA: hypothetical protein VNU97_05610 [Rhizomicrobium sp.]|jgi:hypothetical protein|nr:hypothetical protein [Rhizomicrobium sp.]